METRDRILEAAERVMRTKGLARTTTKEIAQAAGCSEGNLYNHFESKDDLFLCVLRERLPNFIAVLTALPERAGNGTVRGNLEDVARAALAFYKQSVPITASVFAEPELLAQLREGARRRNVGPHKAIESAAAYLRAEQGLGRVRGDASPEAAASLLLGACFQQAYHLHFLGEASPIEADERFLNDILHILTLGLSP